MLKPTDEIKNGTVYVAMVKKISSSLGINRVKIETSDIIGLFIDVEDPDIEKVKSLYDEYILCNAYRDSIETWYCFVETTQITFSPNGISTKVLGSTSIDL